MKLPYLPILAIVLALGAGYARADDMKGMDSKTGSTMDMPMGEKPIGKTHHAVGTVKSVDTGKRTVTISHGAVKTLNWPAMTMTFGVKDNAMLKQFAQGKKVEVDFVQEGSDYNIVKVK
jgi:Cu(I)/Ag(I) efflux system protein CusF